MVVFSMPPRELTKFSTSWDGRMSRVSASRSGRLVNLKVAGSNLDLIVSGPG